MSKYLFPSTPCHVCGRQLMNESDGFYDADTGSAVCWGNCRERHYRQKHRKKQFTYSELPLRIAFHFHPEKQKSRPEKNN